MKLVRSIVLSILVLTAAKCKRNAPAPYCYPIDETVPASRTFYMGFTAFPYDLTLQALEESYANQRQYGDLLLFHFDHGVPWNEALNNLPFPSEVQADIDRAIANKTPGHKVLLTATPTAPDRESLAGFWNNEGPHQQLTAPWNTYTFDSPEVITAYIQYCRRIINQINPDYFAFAIEINASFKENTPVFDSFLTLADTVYHTLKRDFPQLPVFMTFQDQSFNKNKDELLHITSRLLPYSDMVAVSTYPYWQYDHPHRDANPVLFPNSWLREMHDLAPQKPFAVSETGFCAEDLVIPEYDVQIKGTSQWQAGYMQKLLIESYKLHAEFIAWFIYRDYDALYNTMPSPVFKIWKDTGVEDGNGNKRPAHRKWMEWKNLPVVPSS